MEGPGQRESFNKMLLPQQAVDPLDREAQTNRRTGQAERDQLTVD